MATFTVAELFDAIEKNGLKQISGAFFGSEDEFERDNSIYSIHYKIGAACALGQASINLSVSTANEWYWAKGREAKGSVLGLTVANITSAIVGWNDGGGRTFAEIAELGRKHFADYLDEIIESPSVVDYTEYLA